MQNVPVLNVLFFLISAFTISGVANAHWTDNCSEYKKGIEAIICSDSDVIELDVKLTEAYVALLKNLMSDSVSTVKNQQRGWIKRRNKKCFEWIQEIADRISCLRRMYLERINALAHTYVAIPNAEEIIKSCYQAQKQKFEEGSTAEMREGTYEYNDCIGKAIIDNLVILTEEARRDELLEHLRNIEMGIGKLSWTLYNEIEPCRIQLSCGTMYHLFPGADISHVFEEILNNVIRQRREYNW